MWQTQGWLSLCVLTVNLKSMVTCCAVSYSPSNVSGLISSRCCPTTWILCRSFAAVVAFLRILPPAPLTSVSLTYWDQVKLWVRLCYDVIPMSLGGGIGCSNKPNRWVMGAFGGRMCIYHRHAQAQGLASTQRCLSHPFTRSHTYAPTLTEGRVWVRRRKGGLRQSVSVYGLYQARCAVACRECW